nr:NAD(P)-dependent oxidoreductase [uncultured Mucilaginibacter sp.]
MKIAIIGATGFVGSHLLKEALLRKHEVLALVRNADRITIENKLLTVKAVDVLNVTELADLLAGQDAVLSAYNPGWHHENLYQTFIAGSKAIQQAIGLAGVKRLLVVGGAGSLEITPGVQLVDTPNFPEEWKQGALAARDYLNELKLETQIGWTFLSPAIEMHPGTSGIRTGNYRTGTDQPVFDALGSSKISVEDIAVALLDELENAQFVNRRFTVAY